MVQDERGKIRSNYYFYLLVLLEVSNQTIKIIIMSDIGNNNNDVRNI